MAYMMKHDHADNADNDYSITLFHTEFYAYQQAAYEIHNLIVMNWDMSDPISAKDAKMFNDFIIDKDYSGAVDYWNGCDGNCNDNVYGPEYWFIELADIHINGMVPKEFDSSFLLGLTDGEQSNGVVPNTVPKVMTLEDGDGHQSTVSGATCRGTHQEYNDYAMADRKDGTYLCHQCRVLRKAFGSKS